MTDDEEINACIAAIEEAFAAACFDKSASVKMGILEIYFNPRTQQLCMRDAMSGAGYHLPKAGFDMKISMIQLMPKLYDALKEANSRVANAKLTTLALVKQITADITPKGDISE